jgi:hypothetical protein
MESTEPRQDAEQPAEEGKPATEQDEGLGEPDPTAPNEAERRASEGS